MGNMEDAYELQPSGASDPLLPTSYPAAGPFKPAYAPAPRRRRAWLVCAAASALVIGTSAGVGKLAWDRKDDLVEAGWTVDGVKGWIGGMVQDLTVGEDDTVFPTNIGYAGPTPTGTEPALLATAPALPLYTPGSPLVPPAQSSIMQAWGNLSPYYSVKSHGLPESSSLFPDHCGLDAVHWLQRHGARYPVSGDNGPARIARVLKEARAGGSGWTASGDLEFLNNWEYPLGAEILTPFGRSQLYNLGVAARLKYGFLLDRFEGRLPVFRTESQECVRLYLRLALQQLIISRMLKSAQNFASGFFGIPAEEQYHLEVQIEAPGFNSTLAPYYMCPNADHQGDAETRQRLAQWESVFLKDARKRLAKLVDGYDLTIQDTKDFMDLCAYETVALGYSAFCNLFTEKEWRGFEYRNDIQWWYTASFGAPTARAQGMGWVQELVARLSHTRLTQFNSTTNSSWHDDVHFPVNDPLTVDFTHDSVFAVLFPALNLTNFAESGAPPVDHIPSHRSFIASKLVPFATNLQFQVLSCTDRAEDDETGSWWPFAGEASATRTSTASASAATDDDEQRARTARADTDADADAAGSTTKYVRLILNDAAVPLTGLAGCAADDDGLCPLDTVVSALQTLVGETDFVHDCFGDWKYKETSDGRPAR
ncbi:hypothetical protein Q5752_003247 [Cryptotrichosporon argae]